MPQVSTNEFRQGLKLEMDAQPFLIVSNEFVKPGKGQAFNRVKLKNLITGRVLERTFKSGDKCDLADVNEAEMRMLYKEEDGIIFMDESNFDQVKITFDHIGDALQWMLEDLVYEIIFYKGAPIAVEPPTFIEMRIAETSPGEKGNTASGRVLKPAVTENGANIQIPIFIDEGEIVKIDTRTGEYVSRVN